MKKDMEGFSRRVQDGSAADAKELCDPVDRSGDLTGTGGVAVASGNHASRDGVGSRWYVVQAQPRGEMRAVVNLERQAIRAFCPMITRAVRHARKSTLVRVPLFPGYLFVSLDTSRDRWRSVNGTIGVTRIITNGDSPVPVPRGVVEAIQARMDDNGVVELSETLACGQAVKVCDGPFVDFVGRIEHINGPERVRILLELMGRAVVVQTDVRMLMPAD